MISARRYSLGGNLDSPLQIVFTFWSVTCISLGGEGEFKFDFSGVSILLSPGELSPTVEGLCAVFQRLCALLWLLHVRDTVSSLMRKLQPSIDQKVSSRTLDKHHSISGLYRMFLKKFFGTYIGQGLNEDLFKSGDDQHTVWVYFFKCSMSVSCSNIDHLLSIQIWPISILKSTSSA